MNVKYYIAAIIIGLCALQPLRGQDLVLSAKAQNDGGVHISWVPTNDTLWGEGMSQGYTLRRTQLPNGPTKVLASKLKPQPQSWFEANKTAEEGFLFLVGQVLYDSAFTAQAETRDDNRRIQYNYLGYEAELNPAVAEALGLGFFDTTGVEEIRYRYEVEFLRPSGGKVVGFVEVEYDRNAANARNPAEAQLQFDPPGGTPLTRMQGNYGQVNRIEIVAKAYGDSIVLRWAPNNPAYWKATNVAGYGLFKEVYTPIPNTDSLEMDFVLLDSIYPWPLERFNRPEVIADSLALIAAQSLYGSRMTTDEDGFMNQLAESDMRYGMAMLAADRSSLAAQALGLRYVDRDVKPGQIYQYVLLTFASTNAFENALVEVHNVPDTARTVQGFRADSLDRAVVLRWSRLNDQEYSGYLIERSSDGGRSFEPLTDAPLLIIQSPFDRPDGEYEHRDSLPQNYRPYLYRIRGFDAFGEWSAPTQTTGMGIDRTPPLPPVIYLAESTLEGSINLQWEMPQETPDLARFHVLLASSLEGNYEPLALGLPPTARSYSYPGPLSTLRSYYFMVAVEDQAGNQAASLPTYVHLVDDIPPAAPTNLAGVIDTNGVATIVWDHGTELDLIGYRVYVGNHPDHEFAQITIQPTEFNVWYDTIELVALDKQIYYKVVAEDRSHNHSPFSQILALQRPDVVPPAAPAVLPGSSTEAGVSLAWVPSPSTDVAAYLIHRRAAEPDTAQWQLIATLPDPSRTAWADSTAVPDVVYQYTIQARDRAGLLSERSFPVKGRRIFDPSSLVVQGLSAAYDEAMKAMYLRWAFPPATSPEYQPQFYLYRQIADSGWKKIKQLDAETLSYLDRDLKTSGAYAYAVKVVLQNGKTGDLRTTPPLPVVR